MIGEMRRRYSVRRRPETRDGRGERSTVYAEVFQTWGEDPREGSASVSDDAGSDRSSTTYRLRTRFRNDYQIGDQLVDVGSGATFYIQSATPATGRYRQQTQLVVSQAPSGGV